MANKIQNKLTASSLLKAPEFMVCGVVLSAWLTGDEYAALEDYEAEKDLIGLRARLEAVQEQNSKNNRENTSPAYRAQVNKIAALTNARAKKLQQLEDDPFNWDDESDGAYLAMLEEQIARYSDKLDTLKPDPKKILEATTQSQKQLNDFNHAYRNFYLEYAHSLATSRGLTKEKFSGWQERATTQDNANVNELVKLGKAQRNHSEEPQAYVAPPKNMQN